MFSLHFNTIVISIHFSFTIFCVIITMREPMPARLEIAFSRTKMDAVFEMVVSSGNSVGVAIPQPRVAGEARYPGIYIIRCRNAVRVAKDKITSNHQLPGSSGNSVGVAISQPRVEGRSTSTLGIYIIRYSNAVSIAISRRRYLQQDNCQQWVDGNNKIEYNAYG